MKNTKLAWSILALGTCMTCGAPASAQALALSYDLDVRRDVVEFASITIERCAAVNWAVPAVGCLPQAASTTQPALLEGPSGVSASQSSERPAAVTAATERQRDAAQLRIDPAPDTRPRAVPAGRTADFSLTLGAKSRGRVVDEGREVSRFTDTTYESFVHSNAHKGVGIELLMPFQ